MILCAYEKFQPPIHDITTAIERDIQNNPSRPVDTTKSTTCSIDKAFLAECCLNLSRTLV